jgi:hypothetical protein
MLSPATDSLHKTSLCGSSPVRGTATGVSGVRLQISHTVAQQHRSCAGRHATTTDDLFIIKNLPLYLGDLARTWLEHLLRDKIND